MKSFHGNVKQYSIVYSVQYNIIPGPLISKGTQDSDDHRERCFDGLGGGKSFGDDPRPHHL
jgi:hypothetical protein